jgi:hypothetical protein
MMTRLGLMMILVLSAVAATPASAQPRSPLPDVAITGVLTHADHQTYRDLAFTVPAGVARLTVTFAYTGRDQHATIDLGLYDPERFRGWSGGNKAAFTLSATSATPSYLAGPIRPGRWRLVLGVPNLRPGTTAAYTAIIHFAQAGEAAAVSTFSDRPLRPGPAWYRGDLHMHTGHSDGTCPSQGGAMVPCPVFRTLEAAAARGLDFVAVTDHNTVSQDQDLRELQPYFDRLLLIPGLEVTTFRGHANVFGVTEPIDFRAVSAGPRGLDAVLAQVARAGGLIAVNHPALPSGEACMGCGWTVPDTDFHRIQAVEVINGGAVAIMGGVADSPLSGLAFWQARLNAGDRLTAIGGSDNHAPAMDLARPGSVGSPTTVVWAENLSERAILAAIRAGHVFVDVEGSRDRLIEVDATAGARTAMMGDGLAAPVGTVVEFVVHGVHLAGDRWTMIEDGRAAAGLVGAFAAADEHADVSLPSDGARHWVRVEVRSAEGRLLLIGNPIYLNAAGPQPPETGLNPRR